MMRRKILKTSLLVWLALLVVAFVLGALRELLLAPWMGANRGDQAGTIAACLVAALAARAMVRRISPTAGEAVRIGALWTLMTVAFEFGFFHYVMGVPWRPLLADYDIGAGRLWPFFLLTLLTAPCIAVKTTRSRKAKRPSGAPRTGS